MPTYLRPTAAVASVALLPGDPGRALALAQALLEQPLMSNHSRGLWGYTGRTESGLELTIQSTGIGGPSAAAVLRELAELGVRAAVRVGTCRAIDPGLELGEVLVVERALALDGTSRALGSNGKQVGQPEIAQALREGAGSFMAGTVASVDVLPEDPDPALNGVAAVDLATAPLFVLGGQLGVGVGAVLLVTETADGEAATDEHVESGSISAGQAAAAALASQQNLSGL